MTEAQAAPPTPRNWTAPTAAAVGTAAGAFAAVQALYEAPLWIQEMVRTQGASLLVAAVLIALLAVFIFFLPKFIAAQMAQALAMQKVGDQLQVMTGQASKLDEISTKLDDVKFNSDVFGDRLTRIEEKLIHASRQNDV